MRSVNQNREYSTMISRIQRFVILANGYIIQNVSSKKDAQIVNSIVLMGLSAECAHFYFYFSRKGERMGI